MRTINHHHGDTFEFDVEVPADVSYLPSAGDKLWLAIKREPSKETDAPLYYLEQADTRFSIKDTSAIPTTIAQLTDDATHRVVTDTEKASWNAKSTFSGDYNDLTNRPTIPVVPTNVSAFTNDSGYLTLATLPVYNGVVV